MPSSHSTSAARGSQARGFAKLAAFEQLKGLKELWLAGSQVSDDALVHLEGFTQLTGLGLGLTGVTDAGLVHLKELKSLEQLDLHGTTVTNTGLGHLKGLKGLRKLSLEHTNVTPKALEEFRADLPGCRIVYGSGTVIEPKR